MKKKHSKIIIVCSILLLLLIPVTVYSFFENPVKSEFYNKRVLAFYYNWYGNTTVYDGEGANASSWLHWDEDDHDPPTTIAANQTPVLGPYDSADNDTIAQHIAWAMYAGIDTFICSWWGMDNYIDLNFAKALRYTTDNDLNFNWTIYFESVQDRYKNNASEIARQMEYVCRTYENYPCFLHQDGRPVIFCYSVKYEGSAIWQEAIQEVHDAGYDPFLIADMTTLGTPDPIWLELFDGIHIYNPAWAVYTKTNYESGFQQMIFATASAGELACYTVNPGFNDYAISIPPDPIENYWDLDRQ